MITLLSRSFNINRSIRFGDTLKHTRLLSPQLSTNKKQLYATSPDETAKEEEWRRIYRLPLIRLAAAFNRLKIYQGAFTILGTPIVFGLEQAGEISQNCSLVFGAIGGSGFLTLIICSLFFKNLIGFIYINPTKDTVKFSYIDYWGKRHNTLIKVEDLKLTPQRKLIFLNTYQVIGANSDSIKNLKLSYHYGKIDEQYTFGALFED